MRRGEIWTVAGGKDYAGKPRPVVIVQDDSFDATDSITICAFTTDETDAPLFRLAVEPNERNGLRAIMPFDGGQDHYGPKDEGWRARRQVGRRGDSAAQPGRSRVPRAGRLAKDQARGVTSNGPKRSHG